MENTNLGLLFLFFVILFVAIIAILLYNDKRKQYSLLQTEFTKRVQQHILVWREKELESVAAEQKQLAIKEANTLLQKWIIENEARIRQDAITRSQSVITGKVTEHLAPFISGFPYNPKDARFIGSPIDLIVFDGLSEDALKEIVFVEIKTGASTLSSRQRHIRDTLINGRTKWIELKLNTRNNSF